MTASSTPAWIFSGIFRTSRSLGFPTCLWWISAPAATFFRPRLLGWFRSGISAPFSIIVRRTYPGGPQCDCVRWAMPTTLGARLWFFSEGVPSRDQGGGSRLGGKQSPIWAPPAHRNGVQTHLGAWGGQQRHTAAGRAGLQRSTLDCSRRETSSAFCRGNEAALSGAAPGARRAGQPNICRAILVETMKADIPIQ